MEPATMTMATVNRFKIVKMLFNVVDSLTPIHSNSVKTITKPKDKKSGYSERKSTSIGMTSVNEDAIDLFVSASM